MAHNEGNNAEIIFGIYYFSKKNRQNRTMNAWDNSSDQCSQRYLSFPIIHYFFDNNATIYLSAKSQRWSISKTTMPTNE